MSPPTPRSEIPEVPDGPRAFAALFAVSAALLVLEIVQTKICAFSLDPLRIYLAIGVCMLGLGAAATALAIFPVVAGRARRAAAGFAFAAAVAIPLAHWAFVWGAPAIRPGGGPAAYATLLALGVPYFCFGMAIALVLVSARRIGRAYAVNLGGSGLGCLLVFPLLDAFGAERLLFGVSAACVAASLLFAVPRGAAGRVGAALGGAAALVGAVAAPGVFAFPPERNGQLSVVVGALESLRRDHPGETFEAVPVHSRWDRTARVDVVRLRSSLPEYRSRIGGPLETLFFVQDASAGSQLVGVGNDLVRGRELFERTVYGVGYVPRPVRDVLVIGLGGAPDVQTALYHGARRIVGVEINRATIDLVRHDFADFLGRPYDRPEVSVHQMDGRTYLRSREDTFDLIQMSGVDTKSILASGSLAVNENYMYTREAMRDLLARLRPEGLATIVRFNDTDAHRLVSIAVAALRDHGAEAPERHVAVVGQGPHFRAVLVKRSPFRSEEVERLAAFAESVRARPPDIRLPSYDWLRLRLGSPMELLYAPPPRAVAATPFLAALAGGRLDAFIRDHPFDLRPPTDDRPYFFLALRPAALLRDPPTPLRRLYGIVGQLGAVSALCILAPLAVFRGRGLATPGVARALLHTSCLGAGFMLVEIGLIHRFVLLLGHQGYAVSVVLFGLLAGAGLGSLASSRLPVARAGPPRIALAAVVGAVAVYGLALDPLFEAAAGAGFGARLALSLALLGALGFVMGLPFPVAMRVLQVRSASLVAWAIGVNGFASVVGSTLAVPLALLAGLSAVLWLGAALYAGALLSALSASARGAPRAAEPPVAAGAVAT